jgi:hypothetical protein
MGIQDLGAIGEFISSLVIVVTLMVLIYEVRGAKWRLCRLTLGSVSAGRTKPDSDAVTGTHSQNVAHVATLSTGK